jgi:hypothetical protein
MTNTREQIVQLLKQLHMPAIRRSYEQLADQARKESFSYEQYLLELLKLECDVRRKIVLPAIFGLPNCRSPKHSTLLTKSACRLKWLPI